MPQPGQRTPNMLRIKQRERRDSNQEVGTTKKKKSGRSRNATLAGTLTGTITFSLAICEYHNEVDENPDAAATDRQQLDYSDHSVPCIETVNSEPSQENAQEQRCRPVLCFCLCAWKTVLRLAILWLAILWLLAVLGLSILLLSILLAILWLLAVLGLSILLFWLSISRLTLCIIAWRLIWILLIGLW